MEKKIDSLFSQTKKIFEILVILVFIVGLIPASNHFKNQGDIDNFVSNLSELKESVVLVAVGQVINGKMVYGRGTGFFVKKDLIVTAAHVISSNKDLLLLKESWSLFKIKVYFLNGDYEEEVKLAYVDSKNDLAFLRVQKNLKKPFRLANVYNGESVWFCGFNSIFKFKITKTFVLMKMRNFDFFGNSKNEEVILLNDIFEPGNSGGPVYNKNFEVVGLITSMIFNQYDNFASATGIIVSSSSIKIALNRIK